MDRRDFLRCSGYSMALPFLGSFNGNEKRLFAKQKAAGAGAKHAKRLVCISYQLSLYKKALFANAADPFLLKPLDEAGLAKDFTTISGLDHKGTRGKGHQLIHAFLTGIERPAVSFDQVAAKQIGTETRYESLALCTGQFRASPWSSFTQTGMPISPIISPNLLYSKIFGKGTMSVEEQLYFSHRGKSLLDRFTDDAKRLKGVLTQEDQHKLDEYFQSVRGVEEKLARQQEWMMKPYPKKDPTFKLPEFENLSSTMILPTEDLMTDLIILALKNDSTRVISMTVPTVNNAIYIGEKTLGEPYHTLSHKGTHDESSDLITIEKRHLSCVARLLKAMKETTEHDGSRMLDSTIVLAGSGMGNPANHERRDFPLLVGGGGLKHQRHIACTTPEVSNTMACDLFVTLLHRLGVEVDQFGTSRGNLDEILL